MVKKRRNESTKSAPTSAGPKLGHSMDADNRGKGQAGGMRTASTVRRLQMYKQRAKRDKNGKVLKMDLQSRELPTTRIVPDRRWFGNTRVIGQAQLQQFREDVGAKVNDTYSVLLKERKLPLALLGDSVDKGEGSNKARRAHLLGVSPFEATFGKKKTRKKPNLSLEDYAALANAAEETSEKYTARQSEQTLVRGADRDCVPEFGSAHNAQNAKREEIMLKGQSKRIWGELYKVVDSSDVVIQVLDARDPQGTRCKHLEKHLKKNHRQKHMILLLNKCDLVPAWVTKRWLYTLSREYPTLAFHASQTGAFGKGALLSVLRQLARLKTSSQAGISVGFVGYPNVGKSSVINTLRSKKVCKVAPMPGETKIWQYISLTKKINLIDCPGVVYHKNTDNDSAVVLKGVTRISNLDDPQEAIAEVLRRVRPQYLMRAYRIKTWEGTDDFLEQLARLSGKLHKGGEPDLNTAAKMVLQDWQRGKIPYFETPPELPGPNPNAVSALGNDGDDAELSKAKSVLAQAAAAALDLQRKRKVPVQRGLYDEEDARTHEEEHLEDDLDLEDDKDEDLDEEETGEVAEDEDNKFDGQESGDEENANAGNASDTDSDGYGDEGLTWDAVVSSMANPGSTVTADEECKLKAQAGSTVKAKKAPARSKANRSTEKGLESTTSAKKVPDQGVPQTRTTRSSKRKQESSEDAGGNVASSESAPTPGTAKRLRRSK